MGGQAQPVVGDGETAKLHLHLQQEDRPQMEMTKTKMTIRETARLNRRHVQLPPTDPPVSDYPLSYAVDLGPVHAHTLPRVGTFCVALDLVCGSGRNVGS